MKDSVRQFIFLCNTCAQVKVTGRTKTAPLTPTLVEQRLVEQKLVIWSIDTMGPYVPSRKHRNRYLITLTDPCSKWVEAEPVKEANTHAILDFLKKEIFPRYGYPEKILTDNGSLFVSKDWKRYCEEHNIQHMTTSIYTPRQNPVERKNQNIKTRLRTLLLGKKHEQWDEQLPNVLFSMRCTMNQATGYSPAQILFRQNLTLPRRRERKRNSRETGISCKSSSESTEIQ